MVTELEVHVAKAGGGFTVGFLDLAIGVVDRGRVDSDGQRSKMHA